MDIRKLQRAIVDGLEDVKAQDILVFNTEHLSPLFERVIVASGTSNRQTKALASSVRESVKSRGLDVLRMEGEENGEWIIVDCGAAVCHVMQPAIREYYRLEEIWGGKPVKMKMGGVQRGLPKGSEGDADEDEDEPTAAAPVAAPSSGRGRGSSATAASGRPARDKAGPARRRAQAGPDETEYAPERPEVDPPARKRPARPAPGQGSAAPAARKAAAKTARRGVTTSSGSGRGSAPSSRSAAGTGTASPARKTAPARPRRSGGRAEESAVRTVVVAPPKTAAAPPSGGRRSAVSRSAPEVQARPAARAPAKAPSRAAAAAPKPVARPTAKAAPKPARKPAQKATSKPAAKPAAKAARPAAKSAAGSRRKP